MSASVLVLALILVPLFLTTFFLHGSMDTLSYIIVGAVAGFAAVAITTILVILCSRKHKDAISNENGFKIQTPENKSSTPEMLVHTSAPNSYVKANEIVKCNETVTTVCPASSSQNGPQPSQERKVSIASDYTESHYYTEIDEYFINKRKEKQQKKLQHRYDNEAFEEDITIQGNVIQLDNSPFTYEYAYGLNPHK